MRTLISCTFTLVLVAVICIGCGATVAPRPFDFDIRPVRARIDSLNSAYNDHFVSVDKQLYVDRYTADVCLMPAAMPRICGRDSLAAFYFSNVQNQTVWITMNAEDATGGAEQVVEVGNYLITNKTGTELDKGKYVGVWKPEGGLWKKAIEIWNSDLEPRSSSPNSTSAAVQ